MLLSCPLCDSANTGFHHQDDERDYFCCGHCGLVFVPPKFFLPRAAEHAHYETHENDPADKRYRRFLSRLFDPMNSRIRPNSRGLDFGCGPGPTLSVMFEEAGHSVDLYDPFFAADESVFDHEYDFITASEVVEHLHQPRVALDHLWDCLHLGGILGIMTKQLCPPDDFADWYYKNDPTHACFYARQTFEWLANHWQAELTIIEADVVLLRKQ